MVKEGDIERLERILGYLEPDVRSGNLLRVSSHIFGISTLRQRILRQGKVIPEDLDHRTSERNLESISSQAHSVHFLESLDELRQDIFEKDPNKVYDRFKTIEALLPNIIGEDKIAYRNKLKDFRDEYSFSKGMQALTGNSDPDIKAARRYADRIEDESLTERLNNSIYEHLESISTSSDPIFYDQTYNRIIQDFRKQINNFISTRGDTSNEQLQLMKSSNLMGMGFYDNVPLEEFRALIRQDVKSGAEYLFNMIKGNL